MKPMPEAKWPPRGYATRFVNQFDVEVYFHAFGNEAAALSDAGRGGTVVPFISMQEHTHLLSEAVAKAKAQAFEQAAGIIETDIEISATHETVAELLRKASELRENGEKKA